MQTKRETNPLNPVYQSLDGAVLANVIEPLLPAELVKKPLIKVGIDESLNMAASTTLSQEAKNEATNMKELGWGPKTSSRVEGGDGGGGEGNEGIVCESNSARNRNPEYDNMYLINPPAENSSKPPSGRFQLNIPQGGPESTTPKISFRGSNPNSTRSKGVGALDSQRYTDRLSGGRNHGGGLGGSANGSARKSPKVYNETLRTSPQVSARPRMNSNDRKAMSARQEEIDMVKSLSL